MSKILITGGLGFQGSHLTEHLLNDGHEVTVLSTLSKASKKNYELLPKKPTVVWGSITDKEVVNKTVREQDVVFHLAAYINVDESIQYPELTIQTNVNGSVNVLNAARDNDTRFILVSSCEVYGTPEGNRLIDEETELRPYSPYASSKAAVDRICFSYFKTYGLKGTIIRPFNVFGERQKECKFGSVIPIFVREAMKGNNLKVHGTGEQTRDYMHVSDLIRAYDLILKSKNVNEEVYNFGTGVETSIKNIAEHIAERFNVKVDYVEGRHGQVMNFCADITKAKKLGFSPEVDIWTGINKYIYWRKNL